VWLWVREPAKPAPVAAGSLAPGSEGPKLGFFDMLRVRNIALCCAISVFLVAWMIIGWGFFPTYFAQNRGFSGETIKYLLSTLGIASALSGFGAPWISDRIGRKPVMIAFCFAGVITPLAVMYFQGSNVALAALMFIGWTATGAFPLFMGVIPGETISRKYAATAMGLVVCAGEVLGGFGITSLSGVLADRSGTLNTALMIQVACAAIGGVLCLFLLETAPAKVRRNVAAQSVMAKAA
jgi:predicted MFS family arabinose efflux permease